MKREFQVNYTMYRSSKKLKLQLCKLRRVNLFCMVSNLLSGEK
jgi:hypothetical protein